ncbi:hypothetical protein MHLP_00800 [Candidatus Mycoplasma haematolamae str. Purdue]|uniref:Uncharacterized protein n=1 Tax=Mycoplasma haematolamae (strain Purdue) TaxID=1212765 RepID=I7B910_MYCHA|nr:hypothetical protein [Candidatus Mycoplasma haematolamae]AFO51740.1 hypothetical protein MHLP_00800 [Candidatus Mycoplasma haematolamae str. Purdue]
MAPYKAVALVTGALGLGAGGTYGATYLVPLGQASENKPNTQSGNLLDGVDFEFKLKEKTLSLKCLDSSLEQGKKHNLKLRRIDEKSAELICVSGPDQQSATIKMVKEGTEESLETRDEEASDSVGPIYKLECSSYEDYPFRPFMCNFNVPDKELEMTKEASRILFTIKN